MKITYKKSKYSKKTESASLTYIRCENKLTMEYFTLIEDLIGVLYKKRLLTENDIIKLSKLPEHKKIKNIEL
jgi:hypothetical protein